MLTSDQIIIAVVAGLFVFTFVNFVTVRLALRRIEASIELTRQQKLKNGNAFRHQLQFTAKQVEHLLRTVPGATVAVPLSDIVQAVNQLAEKKRGDCLVRQTKRKQKEKANPPYRLTITEVLNSQEVVNGLTEALNFPLNASVEPLPEYSEQGRADSRE